MTTMDPARPAAQAQTAARHGHIVGPTPDGDGPVAGRDRRADEKLHLAFAISNLTGGGAERTGLTLVSSLLDRGHRVDILLTNDATIAYPVPEGARLLLVTADGVVPLETTHPRAGEANRSWHEGTTHSRDDDPSPLAILRDRWKLARSLRPDTWPTLHRFLGTRIGIHKVRAIARYMEEARPDCVLANLADAIPACLLARCLIPRPPPVMAILRSEIRLEFAWQYRMYPRLLPTAARIVTVSHAVADTLRAIAPRAATRNITIHNPVRLDSIVAGATGPAPHPWLEDEAVPVILAIGRLYWTKGFPLLLHAFARVAALRRCRLLILGEGPQRPQLEALIRRLGLAGNVALPGWIENPWAAMARASVFVLASRNEGLPGVLIEALACGSPVVSTDVGGSCEVLEGGRYGALVPVGDEMRLALAIARTLKEEERASPEQRRRRREEGMQRARMFAPERAVEQYLALCRELPAQPERRP